MVTRVRLHLSLLLGLVVAVSAIGCGDKKEPAAKELAAYTVRGTIKALSADEITIHHEAIPTFANHKGETKPMMSMSMPFGIAAGLDTKGLAPGDNVEFTFNVDFDRKPPSRVVAIEKLATDTALELTGH